MSLTLRREGSKSHCEREREREKEGHQIFGEWWFFDVIWLMYIFLCVVFPQAFAPRSHQHDTPDLSWSSFASLVKSHGFESLQRQSTSCKLASGISSFCPSRICNLVKNCIYLNFLWMCSLWKGLATNTLDGAGTSRTVTILPSEKQITQKVSTIVRASNGEAGRSRQEEFKHFCWVQRRESKVFSSLRFCFEHQNNCGI